MIGSPSASRPAPKPAVSFLTRAFSGSLIPSRPGAPTPSRLSGSQPYVERYRKPTWVRSRCDGGCECVRQTWWASEASCGRSIVVVELSVDLSEESGKLHISQCPLDFVEVGAVVGGDVCEVGGAECVSRGDGSCSAGVLGDVLSLLFCFKTIDRYALAMLGPAGVEDGRVVVFNSCSEDRTN